MNLLSRVERLENEAGADQGESIVFIIQALQCDPTEIGPSRAVERGVIGYHMVGGPNRSWLSANGESIEAVKTRMISELQAEEVKAAMVCEMYAPAAAG